MVAFSDVSCSYTASQLQTNLFGSGATGTTTARLMERSNWSREAVKLVDPTVNFANFDKDGDGESRCSGNHPRGRRRQ